MQQQIHRIDEVLFRVGVVLGGVVLLAFAVLKPWQAQSVTGDFLIALPGAHGTVTEIREHVRVENGNVPLAIRQLNERYPQALTVMPVLSWNVGLDATLLALAAGGVVVILLTAWRLRREENRTLTILSTLRDHPRVKLREFVANSDFTRRQVLTAIRLINNRGLGYFVVNDRTGFIEDRKKQLTLAHSVTCNSCGAHVALQIALPIVEAPHCPYCQAGVTVPTHVPKPEAQKSPEPEARQQTLLAKPTDAARTPQRRSRQGSPMSVPLFILLVLFCWPAAVGYAVYKFKTA